MSKIIISTETGADLPYKITVPQNIEIIPFSVLFGSQRLTDGTFDVQELFDYYEKHKKVPTTSAINPREYVKHFKALFKKYPDCKIIHIAYSSRLSVTYQNAVIASNEFDPDKICIVDSRSASAGTGILAMISSILVQKYGDRFTFDEYVSLIRQYSKRIKISLVPNTLDYLRAGGRISGVSHLSATVLGLKPSIVIEDGYIESGKKYRGKITNIAPVYMNDFVKASNLEKDFIVIMYSYGVSKTMLFSLKRQAHKLGFKKSWCFCLGSTVSCHTGPGCIGFAGVENKI